MIIFFWPAISQVFSQVILAYINYINNARDLQSVWWKSVIRCQRGFLYLSKAFDRVWHDGLMYKLKSLGICGKYYGLLHSFISDGHQRVVLNDQSSNWSHIKAAAPQGSILGPLLFLVYINDLPEVLTTNFKFFADDTSLFFSCSWFCSIFSITYWKMIRWYLTHMSQNRRKRLFSVVKRAQLTTKLLF